MAILTTSVDKLTQTESWLKAHERLILGTLILVLALFMGNKAINYLDNRDARQASVSAQILEQQKAQNVALQAQADKDRISYQSVLASAQNAIEAQQRAILALSNQLAKQKQADQVMPLPDLMKRWSDLALLAPGDLTVNSTGIQVTDSGARKTTQTLEEVPILKQQLDATGQIVVQKTSEIAACQTALDSEQKANDGLKTQIADADKAHKDEVKVLKEQANKGKRKWFLIGYIAGLLTKPVLGAAGL